MQFSRNDSTWRICSSRSRGNERRRGYRPSQGLWLGARKAVPPRKAESRKQKSDTHRTSNVERRTSADGRGMSSTAKYAKYAEGQGEGEQRTKTKDHRP